MADRLTKSFSQTAKDVEFMFLGADKAPILLAKLQPRSGYPCYDFINLAQCIHCINGEFKFRKLPSNKADIFKELVSHI